MNKKIEIRVSPVNDHGLNNQEIEEVLEDFEFAKNKHATTTDRHVEMIFRNYDICKVRTNKMSEKYYPSVKKYLQENIHLLPPITKEELIDVNRRVKNIRKYFGLNITSEYELDLPDFTQNDRKQENLVNSVELPKRERIYVCDTERLNGFDGDSFASFLDCLAHIMLSGVYDVYLEGFDKSTLSEMQPMLDRGYLEIHFTNLLSKQNRFIVGSKTNRSKLQITFLPNGEGLEIESLDESQTDKSLFCLLKKFGKSFGVFEMTYTQ